VAQVGLCVLCLLLHYQGRWYCQSKPWLDIGSFQQNVVRLAKWLHLYPSSTAIMDLDHWRECLSDHMPWVTVFKVTLTLWKFKMHLEWIWQGVMRQTQSTVAWSATAQQVSADHYSVADSTDSSSVWISILSLDSCRLPWKYIGHVGITNLTICIKMYCQQL
jgi:hypothetical protein